MNKNKILYTRNLIFGAEDSLVSTVGLLSGIQIGGVPKATIILTGIVLIFVEAFSMGVGSYLTEYSIKESTGGRKFKTIDTNKSASVMFFSYLLSGLIPLGPYLIFNDGLAFNISILCSLIGLFILGLLSAKILQIRIVHSAARMLILGGSAIFIGTVVGKLLR